ncbi:oxysterol-binding protein-related protein 5 [Trichechus manatus latirostris]|uniref:Oxysterol-binding protein n=1 Tax=Trichechus manatus latirostris TaxID=127582 RepID=A0A2Y9G2Z8_TRIMA|nr:oxysterol-binding protein-related protein 5 [Trichechus manatus latirostris]
MKEEAFLRRRFSLCPPSSTPQKVDPRKLTRNLLFRGENELYPLSPGKDMEPNGMALPRDEGPPTPGSATKVPPAEYRLCNGSDKECVSPTAKVTKKETLKARKENYRQEKKRATKQLFSALTDPSVVIMADSLKSGPPMPMGPPTAHGAHQHLWGPPSVHGAPKCLWSPPMPMGPTTAHGAHQHLWGPPSVHGDPKEAAGTEAKGRGSATLPGPELLLASSQSLLLSRSPRWPALPPPPLPMRHQEGALPGLDCWLCLARSLTLSGSGRCWLDALELALRCSSLLRLSTCRQGRSGEPESSPDTSPSSLYVHTDQDLFPLNGSSLGNHLENDAFSDKSEKENAEESDNETQDPSRKTTESGSDQSEPRGSPVRRGTTYVEQASEELGELGRAAQVEAVSEENKSLVWVLLRQLRPGMDLSRVVLPTFVLEPRSFLSKLSDHYHHADLLSRAALEGSAYGRIKQVLRWYLSGFYKKPKGIKKPYNPILGEVFRCCWFHPQTDSHTFYVAEQVSHHPPVSAFHVSNRKDGFCISGSVTAKSKFYGNSLSALLDGKATLTFLNRAEDYTITMPYVHCKATYTIFSLSLVFHNFTIRLKRHTVLLEEQTELESERLWQHVTRAIGEGDQHRATQEKLTLEEAQRRRALERQQTLTPWIPRLFRLDPATQEWRYKHEDLSPWDPVKDITQFEQDGILHTLRRAAVPRQTPFLCSPGPRHKGPGPARWLRKASDQPSGHSQTTESSGSTPESCPELSDEDRDLVPGCGSPCTRCRKEAGRLQTLHEVVLSVREAQQELHRHLSAMLNYTVRAPRLPPPGLLQNPRSWVLLCVFLACQLLINSVLK